MRDFTTRLSRFPDAGHARRHHFRSSARSYEGIPATGKAISYTGGHIVTIANGKVKHAWALEDNLGMMQQLGMALAPAPAPSKKK
jgi:predicted ester cyclase